MIRQYKLRFYNFKLVVLLLAISLFGVQLVASAAPELRNKQLMGVVMRTISIRSGFLQKQHFFLQFLLP